MAKFPFWGMDYSPWSSKNLINWNRLKKFIQIGIDVKCMHTSFDGCLLSILLRINFHKGFAVHNKNYSHSVLVRVIILVLSYS